jgi:hypothetical protein
MILLPNNCKASLPVISPKNWKTFKGPWRLTYRFYDPAFRDENGKIIAYHVNLKGFNQIKDNRKKGSNPENLALDLKQSKC